MFGDDPPASAYREFDTMAGRAPAGSGGVIFTPWLYGERTPVEDRSVRGGFHNLSLSASRDDLVRAVFEGVALNTRWLLGAVERFTRRRLEPIRFIGGGARSDVWCQIFADVLGRTIEQVTDPVNANARGAGLLAAVALGELTIDQVPDRVRVARSYEAGPGTRMGSTTSCSGSSWGSTGATARHTRASTASSRAWDEQRDGGATVRTLRLGGDGGQPPLSVRKRKRPLSRTEAA